MPIINQNKYFNLKLFICGTHLEKKFGNTINIYKKLKKINLEKFKTTDKKLNTEGILISSANTIKKLSIKFSQNKLAGLIIVGDRFEALMASYAAFISDIKIFHLGGGETTLGSIDDKFRDCISIFSSLHFITRPEYKTKLISLGVKKKNIIFSGDTSQEHLIKEKFIEKKKIEKKFDIQLNTEYILLSYHPVTNDLKNSIQEFKNILFCLKKLSTNRYNIFISAPNSDNGSDFLFKIIKKVVKAKNFFYIKNFGKYYYSFMKNCKFLIGNSSSGITDSVLLKVKTINVGDRQKGRIMPNNIINCSSSKNSIDKAIKKILNIKKIKFIKPASLKKNSSEIILKNIKKFT